ncbi:MAG: prolipoprotein diacylglyceryl transferase [Bacteroidaceae bacterium]|nr:prolipoprotein diacylglyceryl transferase [Bacteroidaceae bacterium]
MSLINCAIVWDPSISPFSIFGFEVRYYSLCWVIALLSAYYIVQWTYKKSGVGEEKFEPLFMYCFFGILIGARLGHCLFYEPEYYLANPIEMLLPIRNTPDGWVFRGYEGLASHGGTIGVIIALILYSRKTKLTMVWTLDHIAVAAPLFGAMIRIGNFMNSEIIGNVTDAPWGIIFVQAGETLPRHPAQLYEAIAYLVIFLAGLWLYRKYNDRMGKGLFLGYCLFTIFTFRFFVEFIKEEQVAFEEGMTLIMGQWLSLPFIIIGLYYMIKGIRNRG